MKKERKQSLDEKRLIMRNVHRQGVRQEKKAESSRHPSHLSNHPLLSNLILSTPSHSFVSFSQRNAITGSLMRNSSQLVRTCWAQTVGKDELSGSTKGGNRFFGIEQFNITISGCSVSHPIEKEMNSFCSCGL